MVPPSSARMTILALLQLAKASVSGAFELLPSSFIFWKIGNSLRRSRIQTETAEQGDRDQERNAPAPGGEIGFADRRAGEQDHQQRQEQAERRGGLDERGVVAALALRRMLGHIGRGSAILAAEREALRQTQRDQDDRRGKADGRGVRQQADDEGRQTHDQDGDEEGVFASDDVADASEHDGAERAHQEAGGEGEQREDVARCRRIGREELRADDAGRAIRRDRSHTIRRRYRAKRRE